MQIRLAVSLNSAVDAVRSRIMPINKKYGLTELKKAIITYQRATKRRATLEYVMLKDINDSDDALLALIDFCKNLDVNINLIPFNAYDENFESSTSARISTFIAQIKQSGIEAVKRVSHGVDISAACGQLAVS